MAKIDTLDKIVTSYFSVVTTESFSYKGKMYYPKDLKISPLLLRGFTCPENCAGCCSKFSLDYLPNETHPYPLQKRSVEFNGGKFTIYSDMQEDNDSKKCKHVNWQNGRCKIHGKQPFSCDFELIRTLIYEDPNHSNIITQKLFGRGWQMSRVDGGRGALCEMTPTTVKSIKEVIRKIKRLQQWCNYFQLSNKCDFILEYCYKQLKEYQNKLF